MNAFFVAEIPSKPELSQREYAPDETNGRYGGAPKRAMPFAVLSTDDPIEADRIVSHWNFAAAVERGINRAALEMLTSTDRAVRTRAFARMVKFHAMRPADVVRRMEERKGLA